MVGDPTQRPWPPTASLARLLRGREAGALSSAPWRLAQPLHGTCRFRPEAAVVNRPDSARRTPPFVLRFGSRLLDGRLLALGDEEGYVSILDASSPLPYTTGADGAVLPAAEEEEQDQGWETDDESEEGGVRGEGGLDGREEAWTLTAGRGRAPPRPPASYRAACPGAYGAFRRGEARAGGQTSALWLAHENAVFDLAWADGDRSLVTASGDATLAAWDTHEARRTATFRGHEGSVKAVAVGAPGDLSAFASGGRDGRLVLWDARARGGAGGGPLASPGGRGGVGSRGRERSVGGTRDGTSPPAPALEGRRSPRTPHGSELASPLGSPPTEASSSSRDAAASPTADSARVISPRSIVADAHGEVGGERRGHSAGPKRTRSSAEVAGPAGYRRMPSRGGARLATDPSPTEEAASPGMDALAPAPLGLAPLVLVAPGASPSPRRAPRLRAPRRPPPPRATPGVTSVLCAPDGRALLSGGSDGTVRVWDVRVLGGDCSGSTGTRVYPRDHFEPGHPTSLSSRGVSRALLLSIRPGLAVAAFDPGGAADAASIISPWLGAPTSVVSLWPAGTAGGLNPTPTHPPGRRARGVASLDLSRDGATLLVSLVGGSHLLYDLAALERGPTAACSGPASLSFYAKACLEPSGDAVLASAGRRDACVFALPPRGGGPRARGATPDDSTPSPASPGYLLRGHRSEVTAVAWCRGDSSLVATASDDGVVRTWRRDAVTSGRRGRRGGGDARARAEADSSLGSWEPGFPTEDPASGDADPLAGSAAATPFRGRLNLGATPPPGVSPGGGDRSAASTPLPALRFDGPLAALSPSPRSPARSAAPLPPSPHAEPSQRPLRANPAPALAPESAQRLRQVPLDLFFGPAARGARPEGSTPVPSFPRPPSPLLLPCRHPRPASATPDSPPKPYSDPLPHRDPTPGSSPPPSPPLP